MNKLGLLNVAGRKRNIKDTIKFFTDSNLPLSGPHSIIGRSILIHDDHAPGNKLQSFDIEKKICVTRK